MRFTCFRLRKFPYIRKYAGVKIYIYHVWSVWSWQIRNFIKSLKLLFFSVRLTEWGRGLAEFRVLKINDNLILIIFLYIWVPKDWKLIPTLKTAKVGWIKLKEKQWVITTSFCPTQQCRNPFSKQILPVCQRNPTYMT